MSSIQPALQLLLVEDNPDHAALAKNAILKSKRKQYQIEVAPTAEDAMARLERDNVHMVISDFHLPGKTGLQLLEWINEHHRQLPFIMMTGAGDEKTAVQAMQAGAYNYIVKDDTYLDVLPHVIDETFIKDLAAKERTKYEQEIRQKNAALEKANRELQKLDQLKSDFIASVSHDIRTPLNSVQESVSLILDGVVNPADEQGKKVLGIAKRNIVRLAEMINDLLDFSKLEAGKMRLHVAPADIQVLIDEVLGNLKALSDKKELQMVFDPADNFPRIDCDGDRMVQVLTNLIGNAIKFTPEKGKITVTVAEEGTDQITVTVADTGPGIPKEDLVRIFEKFEQSSEPASTAIKGTGLGLAICKELVKLHHGQVWAESDPGQGSRFIVRIPVRFQKTEDQ